DQVRVEEIVAECMAEQGFDYTPVDYSQNGGGFVSSDDLDVEWGTLEFAKKYGYGATTNPWGDPSTEEPMDPDQEWVDPNQEYVESMSETEQQAYYTALWGEQNYKPTDEGEEYEYDWTTAGCQGKAQHEVYEQGQPWDDEEYQGLFDEMNAMYEQVQNDPRVTGLNAKWADCMADAGYTSFAAVGDAENAIYEKTNKVWDDAYKDLDWETATDEDYKAIEAAVQDQLSSITDEEIATATADYTCRDKIDYTKVQQEVQFAIERDFIEAHRTELEAWKAAYQKNQG
ncbi:MAG TPA: hypothetical protein PKB06_07880, partial [Actinotalea sp.]|nr:hypothetical protein [Actinotalea sp.]